MDEKEKRVNEEKKREKILLIEAIVEDDSI